jgi:hypothetical protein
VTTHETFEAPPRSPTIVGSAVAHHQQQRAEDHAHGLLACDRGRNGGFGAHLGSRPPMLATALRSRPLVQRMVVRTRALQPIPTASPLRRNRFITRIVNHRPIGPPVPGCRPPRVPAGYRGSCDVLRVLPGEVRDQTRPTAPPSSPPLLLRRPLRGDRCRCSSGGSRPRGGETVTHMAPPATTALCHGHQHEPQTAAALAADPPRTPTRSRSHANGPRPTPDPQLTSLDAGRCVRPGHVDHCLARSGSSRHLVR